MSWSPVTPPNSFGCGRAAATNCDPLCATLEAPPAAPPLARFEPAAPPPPAAKSERPPPPLTSSAPAPLTPCAPPPAPKPPPPPRPTTPPPCPPPSSELLALAPAAPPGDGASAIVVAGSFAHPAEKKMSIEAGMSAAGDCRVYRLLRALFLPFRLAQPTPPRARCLGW